MVNNCSICNTETKHIYYFENNHQHICLNCLDKAIYNSQPSSRIFSITINQTTYKLVLRLRRKYYIIYKDDSFFEFKNEELKPITVNVAKMLESEVYHSNELYQARQDHQRGGTPKEAAFESRGFNTNGMRINSKIDKFVNQISQA